MSEEPVQIRGGEEEPLAAPLLTGARDEENWSAVARRTLHSWALFASLAVHVGPLLALLLLGQRWTPLPEPQVLHVTLLSEGPGAAGATGGTGGGAPSPAESAPAPKAEATQAPEVAQPSATPPTAEPAPPTPSEAQTPPPPPPTPSLAQTAAPPEQLPPPPRPKPRPPRLAARTAPVQASAPPPASVPPSSPPQQQAALPTPGTPGEGGGPGGAVGHGSGAEGAGHGAIGNGPVQGPGDDYLDRLRRWLNRYKRYPEAAQKAKQQGHLIVSFTILRDGTVLDPRIEHSSGFPLLDQAALRMLREASPVPPLPERYRAPRLAVALPVDFSIGLLDKLF